MNKEQQAKYLSYLYEIQDQEGVPELIEQLENNPNDFGAIIKQNQEFLRSMPGYSKVEMSSKPQSLRVAEAFDTYTGHPDTYLAEKAEELGMTPDAVKAELARLQAAKEYQEGRARRKKEIENAGLFSPWTLASDYSKQRYIDDPDASMFGKEGNYLSFSPTNLFSDEPVIEGGILSSEGQSDLRDAILGATGAVGDVIPGIGGVVVGPAVRAGRDVYHTAAGDKYHKDWGTIASDVGTDLAFNVGTNYAPTAALAYGAKRTKAVGKDAASGGIGQSIKNISEKKAANEERAAIGAGFDRFKGIDIPTQKQLTESGLLEAITVKTADEAKLRLARNATKNLSDAENLKNLTELFSMNDLPASVAKDLAGLGYTIDDVADIAAKQYNGNIQDAVYGISQMNMPLLTGYSPIAELFDAPKEEIVKNLKSQKEATRWVNSLPDSPFKSDMLSFVQQKEWKPTEMAERIMDWKRGMGRGFDVYANKYTSRVARELPNQVFDAAKRQADAPVLGPWERKGLWVANNWNELGTPVVKEMATAGVGPFGRKASEPKESLSAKQERWSKGFATPDEQKTDEYKQWFEENNKRIFGF